jgi:hypothetical protein
MPLSSGKSKKAISGNIEEMVKSYKQKGSIGNTHPKSIKKAQQIAAAAAYRKAGKK